jgi:toxin FitB
VYVVDTDVISAFAPGRNVPQAGAAWLEANTASLYLSVVSLAEVEAGVAKLRRGGAFRRAGLLASWLESVLELYNGRILPLDTATARVTGLLVDLARGKGHDPGFPDAAIAGTALGRGFTVLTRNLRHFTAFEVPVTDPFAAAG